LPPFFFKEFSAKEKLEIVKESGSRDRDELKIAKKAPLSLKLQTDKGFFDRIKIE